MPFLRVVEVFQPLFPSEGGGRLDISAGLDEFVAGVRGIRDLCDVVLVGDHKSSGFVKFSAVESAAILEREAGVKAAPVVVARDSNKASVRSAILTAYGLGLRNLMVAWGDRYPAGEPKNVYDFKDLASVVSEARSISTRAGIHARILAPVDISSLGGTEGVERARARLKAGADLLLAQPPTTDAGESFERHVGLLKASGLEKNVLLGVFPFKSRADVDACERSFGWNLPPLLHRSAGRGERALLEASTEVSHQIRVARLQGVYLSTRGTPSVARAILG